MKRVAFGCCVHKYVHSDRRGTLDTGIRGQYVRQRGRHHQSRSSDRKLVYTHVRAVYRVNNSRILFTLAQQHDILIDIGNTVRWVLTPLLHVSLLIFGTVRISAHDQWHDAHQAVECPKEKQRNNNKWFNGLTSRSVLQALHNLLCEDRLEVTCYLSKVGSVVWVAYENSAASPRQLTRHALRALRQGWLADDRSAAHG